jgi:ArsR family transcriptional regulator, virulence genes transcriptional regulator
MPDELVLQISRASALLKALCGSGRLLLLCHLWERERTVKELAELTGMREASTSQQLAILRRNRIVKTRREQTCVFYSLSSGEARNIIAALENSSEILKAAAKDAPAGTLINKISSPS